MSTVKRLAIVVIVVLGIPYSLIYLFGVGGNIVAGKIFAISFFLVFVSGFLIYLIFFSPVASRNRVLDDRVSLKAVRKFDLLFRAILFLFLVGLTSMESIPFSIDVYDLIANDERYIIVGERYGKRGNMLMDRVMAKNETDKGRLYQYPYSIERLKPSYNYTFVVLPRSRLILTVIEK